MLTPESPTLRARCAGPAICRHVRSSLRSGRVISGEYRLPPTRIWLPVGGEMLMLVLQWRLGAYCI